MSRRVGHGWLLRTLVAAVGGVESLESLDDAPLADEPFDWTGIAAADRPFVEPILSIIAAIGTGGPPLSLADVGLPVAEHRARFLATRLDTEDRVVAQRLLAMAARNQPAVLRRGKTDRTAVAVVWLVLHASERLATRRDTPDGRLVTADALWWATGVTACNDRSLSIRAAALGIDRRCTRLADSLHLGLPESWLPDVALMRSSVRAKLLDLREQLVGDFLDAEQRVAGAGRSSNWAPARAEPVRVTPTMVQPAYSGTHGPMVRIELREHENPYGIDEGYLLTEADAESLVRMLEHALDGDDEYQPYWRYH